jgi:hypothetical protein
MNRLSDCYFMPNEKLFSYIMAKTSYIQWDDHDVHFVLDQHNELDFHNANSLQQQSNDRHVAPLGHILNRFMMMKLYKLNSYLYSAALSLVNLICL